MIRDYPLFVKMCQNRSQNAERSSSSTLLDWGAQSEECWSAQPGREWWLLGHGCPKLLKCSTSPQEAIWHSSLHFLNQSWVIRAATGKRTDQTIIPPHLPLYPLTCGRAGSSQFLQFFFFISPNKKKEHRSCIVMFFFKRHRLHTWFKVKGQLEKINFLPKQHSEVWVKRLCKSNMPLIPLY